MKLLKSLLSSKKFVTALLAVLASVAIKLGVPEVTATEMSVLISPLLVYIGAQGYAERDQKAIEANAAAAQPRGR